MQKKVATYQSLLEIEVKQALTTFHRISPASRLPGVPPKDFSENLPGFPSCRGVTVDEDTTDLCARLELIGSWVSMMGRAGRVG